MATTAARPFEMFDIFKPTADLISHLLFEEFVMLVLTVVPLFLGLVAALHVLTGVTKGPLDAEESENVRASNALLCARQSRPRTVATRTAAAVCCAAAICVAQWWFSCREEQPVCHCLPPRAALLVARPRSRPWRPCVHRCARLGSFSPGIGLYSLRARTHHRLQNIPCPSLARSLTRAPRLCPSPHGCAPCAPLPPSPSLPSSPSPPPPPPPLLPLRPQLADVERHLHSDVENSTATLSGNMSKVEQQIVDLQRGHDQRFADLHKDLAGIVWELSKLRADMARWQALAQLGGRGSGRGRGGAALPDPVPTSDASARAAAASAAGSEPLM